MEKWGYREVILGWNMGQKPNLVLFETAWLSSFHHSALLGETLLQDISKMTGDHE